MKRKYRCFIGVMILFLLAGCAGGLGVKRGWVPTEAVPSKAVEVCTDLGKIFSYPNTTLTSVSPVPSGTLSLPGISDPMPEHCVVTAR